MSILKSLTSLSIQDRARFVLFGMGGYQQVPYACIHHAFATHVAARPNAIAIEHLQESLTFNEVDKLSNILANCLRCRGILPGKRVCLLVQRSVGMIIAILAVLKTGASYVPVDGGVATDQMIHFVTEDSGSALVLFLSRFRHRVSQSIEGICIDDFLAHQTKDPRSTATLRDISAGHHEAYVIYTSGTTGVPKGVSVSHGNITNLLCLSPGKLSMKPGLRVAQLLNVAFDMCAWEVLGSLINGCTLCIRGRSKEDWETVLRTADVVISTPTILQCYNPRDYPQIKCVATAGEPCPQSLADGWSANTIFYNSCGPTETTIINTAHAHEAGKPLTIGRPTPNNRVYILKKDMAPVSIGEVGVMWAAGDGVSSGYVNRPDLTRERFVADPFAQDGSFMFNTGDLGRWNVDGSLQHLGRIDDQVKIKGFRVELDGVVIAMQSSEEVTQAVALLVDRALWGIVCPANADLAAVRSVTSETLPYYAVPSHLLAMDRLPKTSNGKVDKHFLRELVLNVSRGGSQMSEVVGPGVMQFHSS
ncbi:acetyl-CoA synthetase-like protein [Leucogyrophana mollusca]|uniref:Acetyl-CoA synthetase-like protein n=1 Tax=Leucogyrophana mollusca TaxID=85980 RepID=A0ACB8AWR7_9AGAM|nr:acetyl-CoA synthetase-like protein [Leucogyrophana mollusca]